MRQSFLKGGMKGVLGRAFETSSSSPASFVTSAITPPPPARPSADCLPARNTHGLTFFGSPGQIGFAARRDFVCRTLFPTVHLVSTEGASVAFRESKLDFCSGA